MLVALSAIVLGLSALVVSVVQVRMMHEQQHASVWPRLVVMPSATGERLTIDVSNPGIGPAVIRHVEVSVDGRRMPRWENTLAALVPEGTPATFVWSSLGDRIIPPGASIEAIRLQGEARVSAILGQVERLAIGICYCSVYDRCWELDSNFARRSVPTEVSACTVAESDRFQQ
jgi:hypothetical protein